MTFNTMHKNVSSDDELLDVVNEHDEVIGQQWRSEIDLLDVGPHVALPIRSINAFIENEQGLLWIPRRTATKKRWPSALDMSVSGCVAAGETYEQAFARETQEEVGIDIANVSWECIGHFSPYTHDIRSFMKIYKIFRNDVPDYNRDDYSEYYWLSPQETMKRIASGTEPYKPGLPKVLRLLYKVD